MFHDKRSVGRTVKASKTYHVWEFVLGGNIYKIELFNSVFSGKKKLVLNGGLVIDDEEYTSEFNYHFNLKGFSVKLFQKSTDKFELSIDERPFTLLMEDEASKTFSIVKKNDDTAVEELCGNFKQENNSKNYNKRHSSRPEIPNFFDDNDFDFGEGFVVTNNNLKANKNEVIHKNIPQEQESNLVGEPSTNDKFDLFGLDTNQNKTLDNNNNKEPGNDIFSNNNNSNNLVKNDLFDFTSVKNEQNNINVPQYNNLNNINSTNMGQQQLNYIQSTNFYNGNYVNQQPYMNNFSHNQNIYNYGNPQLNSIYTNPYQGNYGMNMGVNMNVPQNSLNDLSFLQYNKSSNQGNYRNSVNSNMNFK